MSPNWGTASDEIEGVAPCLLSEPALKSANRNRDHTFLVGRRSESGQPRLDDAPQTGQPAGVQVRVQVHGAEDARLPRLARVQEEPPPPGQGEGGAPGSA